MTEPIEIPSQSQLYSTSPESPLIFDMSPFYSDHRYCNCPHPTFRRPAESHYYPFPAIASPATSTSSASSRASSARPHLPLSTPAEPHSYFPEQVITRGRKQTRAASSSRSTSSSTGSELEAPRSPEEGPLRLTPTTTITGFSPSSSVSNSAPVTSSSPKPSHPHKRGKLSPSPARPEAGSWILPGASSTHSGRSNRRSSTSTTKSTASTDSGYTDGITTDFRKFMLQRIERERILGPMRSMRSMRSLAAR